MGVFDKDGAVGRRELAVLRLLGRRLSAFAKLLPAEATAPPEVESLTPRMRQVADLVCEGLTNARIAETLSLTEDTVKKYVTRILAETGCRSRTELVLFLRPRR